MTVAFPPGARGEVAATLALETSEGPIEVAAERQRHHRLALSSSPSPFVFSPLPYSPPGHEGEYQETEQVNVAQQPGCGHSGSRSSSITGPDASSFSIQYGNCENNLLAPGNSCGVGIRFSANSPGPKSASLVLNSDSSASPLVVPLQAQALHGPEISVDSLQALLGDAPHRLLGTAHLHADQQRRLLAVHPAGLHDLRHAADVPHPIRHLQRARSSSRAARARSPFASNRPLPARRAPRSSSSPTRRSTSWASTA